MRIVIAGVLAGIVVFIWGAFSHMVLPLGHVGFDDPSDEAALQAMQSTLPEEGVYMLPHLPMDQWEDEAAVAAFSERAASSPFALVIYQPQGRNPMDMGGQLGIQFLTVVLGGILAAWIVSLGALGFAQRTLVVTAMAAFAWLAISLPYWNWYRFPLDFTVANLVENLVGWTLGGLVIAWWLGRARRTA